MYRNCTSELMEYSGFWYGIGKQFALRVNRSLFDINDDDERLGLATPRSDVTCIPLWLVLGDSLST